MIRLLMLSRAPRPSRIAVGSTASGLRDASCIATTTNDSKVHPEILQGILGFGAAVWHHVERRCRRRRCCCRAADREGGDRAGVGGGRVTDTLQNFVDGEFATTSGGRRSEIVDPSTGAAYGTAPVSGP